MDTSNLCVILIDNKDDAPKAVIREQQRAKSRGLRMIYVFCDENKRKPTVMQEEIKENMSEKYIVVHEFSDIVQKAYLSVMQDIITIYKGNHANQIITSGDCDSDSL